MRQNLRSLILDSKQTSSMALPLIGSRLLHAVNGFINMVLISRLGINAIAASSLIFATTGTLFLMMWAILYSIGVMVGRVYGEGKNEEVGQIVKSGVLLGILLGTLFSLLLWNIDKLLIFLHQPRDLVELTVPYFHVLSFGVVPSLLGVCFSEFVMGIGRTRLVVIWAALTTPCNIGLSYCLLFGKFGFPALGIVGAAWATTITYWGLLLLIIGYFYKGTTVRCFFAHRIIHNHLYLRHFCGKIFKIGLPISLQLSAVATSYTFLTYMIGWLGKVALVAHHIVNQWVTLIIMIPYGIAQASSILVAQAWGSKRKRIISLGYAGLLLGCAVVLVLSLLYWVAPNVLIAVYLNTHMVTNSAIICLATALLALMGVIQLTDSVGVIIVGALRGFHDTNLPMLINVSANWFLSIPLGYLLAFVLNMGAIGLYIGFVVGSLLCGVLLMYRFWYLCHREEQLVKLTTLV